MNRGVTSYLFITCPCQDGFTWFTENVRFYLTLKNPRNIHDHKKSCQHFKFYTRISSCTTAPMWSGSVSTMLQNKKTHSHKNFKLNFYLQPADFISIIGNFTEESAGKKINKTMILWISMRLKSDIFLKFFLHITFF